MGADTGSTAEGTNSVSSVGPHESHPAGAAGVSAAVLLSVPATPNAAITPAFFVVFNYSIPERSDEAKKCQRHEFLKLV